MNESPLVSVIIPSYNHENFIEAAILSVLEQTYKNIQLIVIDDLSTDSTFLKIKSLASKYQFIYEQRETNQGHGSINVNYAVKKFATGKYLAICASDDIWLKDKLLKQLKLMEDDNQIAMCYSFADFIDEAGKINGRTGRQVTSFEGILCFKHSIPAASQLYRMDIFRSLGGYDETTMVEDFDFQLRLTHCYKIACIPEHLVQMRGHKINMSRQILKLLAAQRIILNKWQNEKRYKKALLKLNRREFHEFIKRGQFRRDLYFSLGVFILHPKTILDFLVFTLVKILGQESYNRYYLKIKEIF